jgi:hypothetical protein
MKTWHQFLEIATSQMNPAITAAGQANRAFGLSNVSLAGNTLSITTANNKSVSINLMPDQVMQIQQQLPPDQPGMPQQQMQQQQVSQQQQMMQQQQGGH